METLLRDVRYSIRRLVKSAGFTSLAALSLALGIGANTAIFSLLNETLWRSLPVDDAQHLVTISATDVRNPGNLGMSYLNYIDLRQNNDLFTGILAYAIVPGTLNSGGSAERIFGEIVSGNYFDVLGTRAAEGRTFIPDEDETPDAHPVVVLSDSLWRRRFGADPALIGQSISLNRHDFTVIGIAPKDFNGIQVGATTDFWAPIMMHDQIQPGVDWYESRRGLFLNSVGRLKPSVTIERAQAAMTVLAAQLEQAYLKDNEGRSVRLVPLMEARSNPDGTGRMKLIAGTLMGAVGLLLLIACVNVANLLLTRGAARRKEIAIRLAVGASQVGIVRQLFIEGLLISLLGAVTGLLLAFWARDIVRGFVLFSRPASAQSGSNLDARVLVFTLALAIASALIFALAPALKASRPDIIATLKNEAPASGRPRLRLDPSKTLVVIQVALSLLSLICSGLLVRSLRSLTAIDPGFISDNIVLMGFDLGLEGFSPFQGKAFYRRLVEQVEALPGVHSAALARSRPFSREALSSVFIEGQESLQDSRGVLVSTNTVGPGFFETLGIPLLQGRGFTEQDGENSPKVIVVNETMANRFWPAQEALGKRLKLFGEESFREVIGVARDAKYNTITEGRRPFMYLPLLQNYSSGATLHVRMEKDTSAMLAAVTREFQKLDASVPILTVQLLPERIARSLAEQRSWATLSAFFGLLALVLCSVGLYGVILHSAMRRAHEVGIRMALGARRGEIIMLVLKETMSLASIGVFIGLAAAFILTRVMAGLLFGVSALDPMTFAAASLVLAGAAMLAGYIPARKAASVDPILALRYE
jgi:predicted permease